MVEVVEFISLREGVLAHPTACTNAAIEDFDRNYEVFPAVNVEAEPLSFKVYYIANKTSPGQLTVVVGSAANRLTPSAIRIFRGTLTANEVRERSLKLDRAHNYVDFAF